uniref:forkhead box protein D2-like n=1 Tax=Semicossyphus pulcher TaxID=241346 RepID=UPI0037E73DA8
MRALTSVYTLRSIQPTSSNISSSSLLTHPFNRSCSVYPISIMAARRPARIPEDLARQMILDGWDEEPIGGFDSGSEISDVEDPDYCPPGDVRPPRDVRPPGNQPPPTEDQSDTEEEEKDIVSNRMSHKGSYRAELPPSQAKTPSHNIRRSRSGPAPGFRLSPQ